MLLLGLDIGSSSVKASLVDARTGRAVASASSPASEMRIDAPRPGWAEQPPELWWAHCRRAISFLFKKNPSAGASKVAAIGISYQMHGLVAVDGAGRPVRPAIIWCDSRAVGVGERALAEVGASYFFESCLNAPGNFTASKLAWVKENEPAVFEKIEKAMLPGDYIALRMTGEAATTVGGLSEGVFWDFKKNGLARPLLDHFGLSEKLLPPIVPTFGPQGFLTKKAAAELGLPAGIPVAYRAGDQPNNALSLNVLRPGEVAATGGTSGVIYAVSDLLLSDEKGRVNTFAHVNHSFEKTRTGLLLCINGAGSQYRWLRREAMGGSFSYEKMERLAAAAPPGSDGLRVLPFGNGAERLFSNRNPGGQIVGLDFNRHGRGHLCRAALEGIAFAFAHGAKVLNEIGVGLSVVRAGEGNLFQSEVFSSTVAALLGCRIEILKTNGATGAAIAVGAGIGLWAEVGEGLRGLETARVFEPEKGADGRLGEAFEDWERQLAHRLQV